MLPKTFRARRRLAIWLQAAILAGLPFLKAGGESACRFDIPTLKLYFFGSVIWISESYFFLLIFLLFFIGVMLFTVLYGRIWCGWMCPQTALSEVVRLVEQSLSRVVPNRFVRTMFTQGFLVLFSAFVAADLIWYFVSPYQMFKDISSFSLGPWTTWTWLLFTGLLAIDLTFVRQRFCRSVCPYARLQSAFFDDATLTIAFNRSRADECRSCDACVRACPTGIDIKNGLQVECINCAECIDACARQMERGGKAPLIAYFRGTPGVAPPGRRIRVLGLSLVFAFFAVLFAYTLYIRVPVDFFVSRDEMQPGPAAGVKGMVFNAYSIVLENHSLHTVTYRLSVEGINEANIVMAKNPIVMPPNTTLSMKVYVFARRKNLVYRITPIRFSLENTESRELRLMQGAPFIYPDRTEQGVEI